jgi:cellulose synthase/poly-beta-1,6-N-acetylglucosamine synthase-like glycosyltransferase
VNTTSVLINKYNSQEYFAQAIDSALAQDYPPIEMIVVDDGSTDNSRSIIDRLLRDTATKFARFPEQWRASGATAGTHLRLPPPPIACHWRLPRRPGGGCRVGAHRELM